MVTAHQRPQLRKLDSFGAQHFIDARLLPDVHRHLAQLARPGTQRLEHPR
jgi:hypothetical protein